MARRTFRVGLLLVAARASAQPGASSECCSWDGCGECGETTEYCAKNKPNCEACDGAWCGAHDTGDIVDKQAACCSWDGCGECGETSEYCSKNKANCEVCEGEWCDARDPPDDDAPPCADSPTWVKAKKKPSGNDHGCPWVAAKPKRCEKVDAQGTRAADACPVACGTCGSAVDPPFPPRTTLQTTATSLTNLFAAHPYYVNPTYAASLDSSISSAPGETRAALEEMKFVASAYWIDVKAKISLEDTSGLRGILLDAVAGSTCKDGLEEYRTQYIDPFAAVLAEFDGVVPVALVIEPDSLPNFVTNSADLRCGNPATTAAYTEGIKYAVTAIAAATDHVAMYLDAAHGGWLGWDDNLEGFATAVAALGIEEHLRGLATNVANYQPLGEPCPAGVDCIEGPGEGSACCADPCGLVGAWNRANNEYNYATRLVAAFKAKMPTWDPRVIIDTGRSGNAAARGDCATWCNPRDMGAGLKPTAQTLLPAIVDALYWRVSPFPAPPLKTPGESDGCTELLPSAADARVSDGACARFDADCARPDSIGTQAGEPFAPEAGHWFDFQVKMLAANAAM
ncbi:1, 4-beta cellobiohydrolase [Pelagophyceae sp. CCMP2097]|nr:1, 4-beta cellobiohydrolase [Pelagophyceae sp. CCMP2097]